MPAPPDPNTNTTTTNLEHSGIPTTTQLTAPADSHPDSDTETDSIFAELEASISSDLLTAQKEQLTSSLSPAAAAAAGAGRVAHTLSNPGLVIPSSEGSLITSLADAPAAVVIFHAPSMATSARMKGLLADLAREYATYGRGNSKSRLRRGGADVGSDSGETQFFAAEAERCEWLARKLGIKVLPVVVGYVDGKEVGRIVGFEGVRGGAEGARWIDLARVVGAWGQGWDGTMAMGGGGGTLGEGWREWVDGRDGIVRRRAGSESEGDEDERERRRRAGFVGGGGGNYSSKVGGRKVRQGANKDDDDDDWD